LAYIFGIQYLVAMRAGKFYNLLFGERFFGFVIVTLVNGTEINGSSATLRLNVQFDGRLSMKKLLMVHERLAAKRTLY
jgi:hypothetical protein